MYLMKVSPKAFKIGVYKCSVLEKWLESQDGVLLDRDGGKTISSWKSQLKMKVTSTFG
jgi:hypothetical protein